VTSRRLCLWLAAVTGIGAGLTFFAPGVLHGTAAMNGSARGTALVLLLAGVPTLLALIVAAEAPGRVAVRADVIRLGVLGYVTYNCLLLLFATPFNELFLIYVVMLGLALAALVTHGARLLAAATPDVVVPRGTARALAVYTWVVVLANAAAWLAAIVPALSRAESPAFLDGTGLTTNPVYVQDLAVWLPLAAVAAGWLWRGRPRGTVLVGGFLAMWVLESVSIAVDQWFGAQADPRSSVVSSALVVPFVALAAVSAVALLGLLRRLQPAGPVPVPAGCR
jgi:hypothetical protein